MMFCNVLIHYLTNKNYPHTHGRPDTILELKNLREWRLDNPYQSSRKGKIWKGFLVGQMKINLPTFLEYIVMDGGLTAFGFFFQL